MTGFMTPQMLREKARSQNVMLLREFPSPEAAILGDIPARYQQVVQANQRLLAFHSYKAYKLFGRGVTTLASSILEQSTLSTQGQVDLAYTPRYRIKANSGSTLPWANSLMSPLTRDKVDDYIPELQAVIVVLDAIAAVAMTCNFEVTPAECYDQLVAR